MLRPGYVWSQKEHWSQALDKTLLQIYLYDMSQPKTKPCECGRGKLMTGEHSRYNARNKAGKQVCVECLMDEIREKIG